MNTYRIINPRIGNPGDKFTPENGVNVNALLEAGFIADDDKPRKTTKHETPEE